MSSITSLPDNSRLWCFTLAEKLTAEAAESLRRRLASFVAEWTAHGVPVRGAIDIAYNKFILVAADVNQTDVSGCSIDSLFQEVRAAVTETGLSLADPSYISFRSDDNGEIEDIPRQEFSRRAAAAEILPGTIVFNNTVTSVGDLKGGAWEVVAGESWHRRYFGAPSSNGTGHAG